MFIIFMEWCRRVRNQELPLLPFGAFGILVMLAYPALSQAKWVVRASAGTAFSGDALLEEVFFFVESVDYWDSLLAGLHHVVGRLQSVSHVVDVMRLADVLQQKFSEGAFVPFWMEGLHGIAYERLLSGERPMYIGVAYTEYGQFNFDYEVGDWNVSLGYPSWFFIAPYLIPVYFLYTLTLGCLSCLLLKKIGETPLSQDGLWYIWLVYLAAPWFGAFVNFIYALIVFLVMKILVHKASMLSWSKTTASAVV